MSRTELLLVAAAVIALFGYSEVFSLDRAYQVDELQNIYTARLHALGVADQYTTSAPLIVLGPLTWLAGAFDSSASILRAGRALFLPLFWCNVVVLVWACGYKLRTRAGAALLLAAACLPPLWHYGIEVRHDNALVTLVLLGFDWARWGATAEGSSASARARALAGVGACAAILPFVATKGIVYAPPLVLIALLVGGRSLRIVTQCSLLAFGGVLGAICCVAVHHIAGTWEIFAAHNLELAGTAIKTPRLSSSFALFSIARHMPIALAFFLAAGAWSLTQARRSGFYREILPEAVLCGAAWVTFFINPNPYPYNLLHVIPQSAIFAVRVVSLAHARGALPISPWVVGALAIGHLTSFMTATYRQPSNARQELIADVAEVLTDPVQHRVLDGSGLVAARLPPGRHWLIHSLTLPMFADGTLPSMRSQLALGMTPVIINSYRTMALPPEDQAFIAQHYISLTDDISVSGGLLHSSTKYWNCLVPGRYEVSVRDGELRVDGEPTKAGPMTFKSGEHAVELTAGTARVIWLGPTLEAAPQIPDGDRMTTYAPWL